MPKGRRRKSATEKIGRWRKIYARMWADNKFRALSPAQPSGQVLWIYLLTGPQTTPVPGLCVTGEAGLAESLGWPLEQFRERFREIAQQGMAKADWNARLIYLPNAIKFNEPENPNVVLGWRIHWDEMPDCPLKEEAFLALKAYFVSKNDDGFQDAFKRAIRDPGFAELLPERYAEPLREPYMESGTGTGTGTGGIFSSEKPTKNGDAHPATSNGQQSRQPPQSTDLTRPSPDALFDAIAAVTNSDPNVSASHIGAVRKRLLTANPPYTADEVLRWAEITRDTWPDYPPTLGMVDKYIGRVRGKKCGAKPTGVETDAEYEARTKAEREQHDREQQETIAALKGKKLGGAA